MTVKVKKMTIKNQSYNAESDTWSHAKRMAFWDQGKFTFTQWRAAIKRNDVSVIRQSVNYMRAADFIGLAGEKLFIKSWPSWRALGISDIKLHILDAAWSRALVGDVSFPVDARVTRFHAKKLSTLRAIVRSDGTDSIYQLSKKVGRNYRRVHDDVIDFAEAGLVKLEKEIRRGRAASIAKVKGVHL